MDNEEDLVHDFRVDLMLEISEIFSHHSLVEGWDEVIRDLASEPTSELISRCNSRYHSKMLSSVPLARSSMIR
jgi:hypothetical protein